MQVATRKVCTRNMAEQKQSKVKTVKLMERKQDIHRNTQEYKDFNRNINKYIRKNLLEYNTRLIQNTLEQNSDMKVLVTRSKKHP